MRPKVPLIPIVFNGFGLFSLFMIISTERSSMHFEKGDNNVRMKIIWKVYYKK